MVSTFAQQVIAGTFNDTRGKRWENTTSWSKEGTISSIWTKESINWWDAILTENSDNLLTEEDDIIVVEKATSVVWTRENLSPATSWVKE